jgi:hypothetical protein
LPRPDARTPNNITGIPLNSSRCEYCQPWKFSLQIDRPTPSQLNSTAGKRRLYLNRCMILSLHEFQISTSRLHQCAGSLKARVMTSGNNLKRLSLQVLVTSVPASTPKPRKTLQEQIPVSLSEFGVEQQRARLWLYIVLNLFSPCIAGMHDRFLRTRETRGFFEIRLHR